MPDVLEPLDINQAAVEIAATISVFGELPDTPLARWLEYRAYHELVHILRSANELPADYVVLDLDALALREWLLKGTILKRRFSEEALHLLTNLQAAGSGVIDNICRFYCAWKKAGLFAFGVAGLALQVHVIATIVAAHASFMFLGGLPLTAVIAFLLQQGVLDKWCDCQSV